MREVQPQSEKQQRIARVVELFAKGLDDTEDCIGYHGTSLEAIQYLIENGHWPGGVLGGEHYGNAPGINFYPLYSQFPNHELRDEFLDEEDVVDSAASYADSIAKSHALLKLLDLPINDDIDSKARSLMDDGDYYDFFLKIVKDKKRLDEAVRKASKRKGVVIALSKSLFDKYTLQHGDTYEGDLRLIVPDGMSIALISGIKPMGEEEREFFEILLGEKP